MRRASFALLAVLAWTSVASAQTVSADRFRLNTGPCYLRSGAGSPEGVVAGNVCDVYVRTDGGSGTVIYVKESGAGTTTGWKAVQTTSSGAPIDASYITRTPDASLTNEQALSALATALVLNTTGTGALSAYGGTSCTGTFVRALSAVGGATCEKVALTADVSGLLPPANGGTGLDSSASSGVPTVNAGTWVLNNVLSSGRVLFGGASNTIGSDANLYWDNTNKRFGIGTTVPASALHVFRSGYQGEAISVDGTGYTSYGWRRAGVLKWSSYAHVNDNLLWANSSGLDVATMTQGGDFFTRGSVYPGTGTGMQGVAYLFGSGSALAVGGGAFGLSTTQFTSAGPGDLVLPNASGEIRAVNGAGTDTLPLLSLNGSNQAIFPQNAQFSGFLGHPSYVSQTTAWRITAQGEADFRYLFTDEIHAKSFVTDLEQALAGGQVIGKSVAMVAQTFTCPAAGGSTTLWVRDLPSAANMAAFEAGDFVTLRTFSRAAGSLTIADCVGTVAAYADGSGANEGQQSWTFTRASGTNGGSMTAGTQVQPDALALDFGISGNGYWEVNAIDGAYGANSPYAQVVTWATSPVPTNRTVRARLGRLRGITGVADEYGLLAGSYAATNGAYFRASNSAFELHGIDQTWWSGTSAVVRISPGGGSPYLGIGNPAPTTYGATGIFQGWSGGAAKLSLVGAGSNRLLWDGTNLTTTGTIEALAGYFGDSSNRVVVEAAGLNVGSTGSIRGGQTAYDTGTGFWLGNAGGVYKLSVGNSAGNKLTWDGSTLAVTGTITASSGTIGGWTIGATTLSATNIVLTSGAANTANITVGTGSTAAGLGSPAAASDIAIWAGSTFASRASAPFRVTASGDLTATSATVTGTMTANAGYIGGTGGWVIQSQKLSATNAVLWSNGTSGYASFGNPPPTSYGANVGAFLGYDTTPKFSLYADASNYLQWDGSKLTWRNATTSLDASGNLLANTIKIGPDQFGYYVLLKLTSTVTAGTLHLRNNDDTDYAHLIADRITALSEMRAASYYHRTSSDCYYVYELASNICAVRGDQPGIAAVVTIGPTVDVAIPNKLYLGGIATDAHQLYGTGAASLDAVTGRSRISAPITYGAWRTSAGNLDPAGSVDDTVASALANESVALAMGWNRSAGGGEVDFVMHRGAGSAGGYRWYEYDATNGWTLLATLGGRGDATFTAQGGLRPPSAGATSIGTTSLPFGEAYLNYLRVGAPAGATAQTGRIDASAVYDDGVLLTDWVFEEAFGADAQTPRSSSRRLYSLAEAAAVAEREHRLPWMPTREEFQSARTVGGMITRLWQGQEQQFLYILELERRIRALEEARPKEDP